MNALTQREALALSEQSARELDAILERNARAQADIRGSAASSILAAMNRAGTAGKTRGGRQLLEQVRYGRHGV
jgi:hypothetical protein